MAKSRQSRPSPVAEPGELQRVAGEVFAAVRKTADDRLWFPNGIDNVSLQLTAKTDGVTFSLTISGPKREPLSAIERIEFAGATEQKVMDAAKDAAKDAANLKDCNKFVKAVAASCGVAIEAGADAERIVDIMSRSPWTPLDDGDNEAAMDKAAAGKLVLAGMRKGEFTKPHSRGHVAVVHGHAVSGHPGFPRASWGSLDGTGPQAGTFDGSIRDTFPVVDLDRIHYSFRDI